MTNWRPSLPPFRNFKKREFAKYAAISGFIYQIGESSILRKPSKEVSIGKIKSREFREKVKYLKNCLLKYRKLTGYGRGITAVQVGIPERFSVIYKGQTIRDAKRQKKDTSKDLMVIINPKIKKKSKVLLKYPEGCMSANPVLAPTIRPSWVEFEYYDENGNLNYWDTKANTEVGSMMNRVLQHEIDHIDGVICIDKVKNPNALILWSDPKFYDSAKFEEVQFSEQ